MTDFEEKLIKEVRKRSFLYDKSDANHLKRAVVARAWAEIGAETGRETKVCRKRWRSLRDTYRARTRNLQNGLRDEGDSGSGWQWFESLGFLDEHTQSKPRGLTLIKAENSNFADQTGDSSDGLLDATEEMQDEQSLHVYDVLVLGDQVVKEESRLAVEPVAKDGTSRASSPWVPSDTEDTPTSSFGEQAKHKRKLPVELQMREFLDRMGNLLHLNGKREAGPEDFSPFAIYLSKEMKALSAADQEDFKYDVLGMLRDYKKRCSQNRSESSQTE